VELDLDRVSQMGDPATPDGRELLRELYGTYLDDMRAKLARLRAAATAGDATTIRKLAHEQKGASGMVGARCMAERFAALETRAGESAVPSLIDDIETSLPVVASAIASAIGD
jgi:HPt (histidine-containing phosphotransfer) domain-containing protein